MVKQQKTERPKKSVQREILEWVLTFAIPIVAVLLLHNYVFTFATVSETSMLETLQDGQWLAVSVLHYRIAEPQRGDIVTCHYPGQGEKLFVKRVVGLPGETLQIESGRVYIDGQALDETYVVYPSEESLSIQLEEDQYFIMGDNRAVSLDSRTIGPLSRDQLHGYVLGAVFPFDRFRWFS